MQKLALLIAIGVIAAIAPSAVANGTVKHCANVRGFYNVTVRNMTCHRAAHTLWHARGGSTQIEGYRCRVTGYGPGGGFPAEAVCIKGPAHARGWVIDGPPEAPTSRKNQCMPQPLASQRSQDRCAQALSI